MRSEYLPFGKPIFSEDEIEAVGRVMRSGWIGMGPETHEFERELELFTQADSVVTVNSCTSGLFLSLLASGVGPGDEVICPSFTWCSTANAALYLGATPVFCDIDRQTFNASPQSIEACISERTKAVIVVHVGGLAMDVKFLRASLPDHIALIEDAAHAIGSRYPDGSPVGSSGNLVCFSFYANKNLSTGEGGAIATNSNELAERLKKLRLHALPTHAWQRFNNAKVSLVPSIEELGYKMNFTDLQAAIGRGQLSRMTEFAAVRQQTAEVYVGRLPDILPGIGFQSGCDSSGHAKHLFMCVVPDSLAIDRDGLIQAFREHNIGATLHYRPLHTMPLYQEYARQGLENTDWVGDRVMTLPIGNAVTEEDLEDVCAALKVIIG